jgi:hypothetical protein
MSSPSTSKSLRSLITCCMLTVQIPRVDRASRGGKYRWVSFRDLNTSSSDCVLVARDGMPVQYSMVLRKTDAQPLRFIQRHQAEVLDPKARKDRKPLDKSLLRIHEIYFDERLLSRTGQISNIL